MTNKINIVVSALVALVVSVTAGFVTTTPETNKVSGLSERDVKAVTLDVTDDVTFRKDVILKDSTFCIDFYATSTATQNKMVASSTATIEGVDGVILMGYGSCQ